MRPVLQGVGSVVDEPAEITDATLGKVRYAWRPEDVDAAGHHHGEFEVTFGDSTVETFPNGEWVDLEILADLD